MAVIGNEIFLQAVRHTGRVAHGAQRTKAREATPLFLYQLPGTFLFGIVTLHVAEPAIDPGKPSILGQGSMLQLNLPTLGHWRLQGKAKRIAAGVIGRGNSLALVDYSGGSKCAPQAAGRDRRCCERAGFRAANPG